MTMVLMDPTAELNPDGRMPLPKPKSLNGLTVGSA